MKQLFILFTLFLGIVSQAQLTPITGVVNLYYPVDTVFTVNCRSHIGLTNRTGLTIGDDILIIQMQGAVIDTSNTNQFGIVKRLMNAGNFEFATIIDTNGNDIELKNTLSKYFNASDKVQVVKIAKYKSALIFSTVTCSPWNGNTGGIIALDIVDTLLLNAPINASDKGFRGGNLYPNASFLCNDTRPYWSLFSGVLGPKGEGIYKYNNKYESGMNFIATGGGGGSANNSGGGGGANAGQGGDGGAQSTDCGIGSNNGLGAYPVDYTFINKLFLGAGGGAGQQDENLATPGMNGGGIIFIKAKYIIGNSQTIEANGGNQTADAGDGARADGAGAGGAGGCIVLDITNYSGSVNISAKGGKGGNTRIEDVLIATGPGGGGGGGLIWHKGIALPPSVITTVGGGLAGTVINSLSPLNGTSYWALDGVDGIVKDSYVPVRNTYTHPNIISINNDTAVCAHDSVLIQITIQATGTINTNWTPSKGFAYTSVSSAMIAPGQSGYIYASIIDTLGCTDIDSMYIEVWPLPTSNLLNQYIIQLYDSIQLHANVYDSIYWAPNRFIDSIFSFNPTFSPPSTQLYRYYLVDSNQCIYYDSLLIKVKQCTNLGLANIFTPNGDGINDTYHFNNILIDELISFQIFTRWGELVFETNNLGDFWDGTFHGKELSTDVYTYQIKGKCYGAIFQDSGNISLIR